MFQDCLAFSSCMNTLASESKCGVCVPMQVMTGEESTRECKLGKKRSVVSNFPFVIL